MQQLLIGKKRLAGFDGGWKQEKLGNLFAERSETRCEHLELLAITGIQGVIYPENSEEQNAIVSILEAADRDIDLLRQDIEQEKQKKKALMQLLLTGIVRVNA